MKKVLGETQTLHSGCSEAEPKIFAPPQTPFPGARDGQNLINITTFTCRVQTQFGESRGNRPTNKHTHTPTNTARLPHTGPITIHRAAKLSAQCSKNRILVHMTGDNNDGPVVCN